MKEIVEMLKNQFEKMNTDGSWIFGAVTGGVAIVIPEWIYQPGWSGNHTTLIGILFGIIILEWLVGSRLAKRSPVKQKTSEVAIDSLIRDILILGICSIGLGLDKLFGTGSIIFTVVTSAFIYHNFYSLMANVAVLGWEKHFPMWLLKWLDNEIKVKTKKYFPNAKDLDKKEVK